LRVTSEISPVIEAHAAAVKRGDVDAMMADIAEDVVMFDVVDPLRRIGRATARDRAVEWLAAYDGSITWENRDISIVAWQIVHEHTSVPMMMDGSGKAATDLKP
jgi:ketosteroid isomerase-like protein